MVETNWAGNHVYAARAIHRPESVDQLRDIVADAPKLKAIGTRHTFNDIGEAPVLIRMDGLDDTVSVDREQMTARVPAGVRYGIVAETLHQQGLALHNMGSLPHISIGGATATATHGSGNRNGNLASAVRGLELVTSSGALLNVERGDPNFDGMVVHLGALGIVTHLTLDVQPTYDVCQEVLEDLPWESLLQDFDTVFSSAYSVSVFTMFGEKAGVLWRKHRLESGSTDVPRLDLYGAKPSARDRPPMDELGGEACTKQLLDIGPWCHRLPHFRLDQVPASGEEIQSEYFVDRSRAAEALTILRTFEPRMRHLLMISELRTVAADSLWLSTAHDHDVLAIHFSWFMRPPELADLLPELEAALAPLAPRPHWGKSFAMTGETLPDLYPEWERFRALRQELDPRGAFVTPYLERVGLA